MSDDLLKAVLAKLDRGDAPDSKYPDRKGEYWTLCPFHADNHIGSFSVSERGYKCYSCGESGSLRKLAQHLGVLQCCSVSEGVTPPPSPRGLTLAEYARAKRLPVGFLREVGVRQAVGRRGPYVVFDYRDETGKRLSPRFRFSMHERPKSKRGGKAALYGLWRLSQVREAGWVLLVEGESDCHTAWLAGLPALGLPGAANWRAEWAEYLTGLQVYVWREPDQAGERMTTKLRSSLPDALVIRAPDGVKDISQAHCDGQDVAALVERLKATAQPIGEARPDLVRAAQTLADLAPWTREQLANSAGRETKQTVADEIAYWLLAHERLVLDTGQDGHRGGRPYLVADDGALWPIEKDVPATRLTLHHAGLNGSEPAFTFTLEHLVMTALDRGRRVRLSRWTEARDEALYISCGPCHLVRATADGLEKLPNGTDGVWFAGDAALPEWTPAEPVYPLSVPAFNPALEAPPEVPAYTPGVQRMLTMAWVAALLSGLRPLPLLCCIGQRGGGKSTLAKALLRMVAGPESGLTTLGRDPRDLEVLLTSAAVGGLDNLDAADAAWLPDMLAAAVTGVVIDRRELYTDFGRLTRPVTAAVIITTRSAGFARADVAERSLPILTGEFADADRRADSDLLADVDARRDGLLSWAALTAHKMLTMRGDAPDGLPLRFQDFAKCVWAYLKMQGNEGQAPGILRAMQAAQALTIGESDELAEAILAHADALADFRGTASELVRLLQDKGASLPYLGGGKAIARNLREIKNTLALAGVQVYETQTRGRAFFSFRATEMSESSETSESDVTPPLRVVRAQKHREKVTGNSDDSDVSDTDLEPWQRSFVAQAEAEDG